MAGRITLAKGNLTRKIPGQMSGLESRYAAHLEMRRQAGEIIRWVYEGMRLKLADLTYYNVDFYTLLPDGHIELIETKGSWKAPNQDKSRVKIKVAADQYPEFLFFTVTERRKRDGGGFEKKQFTPTAWKGP